MKREYPEWLISGEMDKVKFSNIERKSNSKTQKGIPLVATYHPLLKSLSSIVNNNIYLLHMDQQVKRTFTPQPMVSCRSTGKLSSYLVKAKLYPIERKVESCNFKGKRCEVCKIVLETDTFTCSNDQTTYKVNHKFDCNEKCLVYFITYNKCLKQYVGQTGDMFRSGWSNYKDNSKKYDRGEECMQRHLYKHFRLPYHTGFRKIPMLLSLIRPILRHPQSVKITGFIHLIQKHLWDLMLKVTTELLSYIVIVQLLLYLDLDDLF